MIEGFESIAGAEKEVIHKMENVTLRGLGNNELDINYLTLVNLNNKHTFKNISVFNSQDDGIEIFGGSVNMSNITVHDAMDDYFDTDHGHSGVITNLKLHQSSQFREKSLIECGNSLGSTRTKFVKLTYGSQGVDVENYVNNGSDENFNIKSGSSVEINGILLTEAVDEIPTKPLEFVFSVAVEDDINVTWYDADTNQDPIVSALATLKTPNSTLGTAAFSVEVQDDDENKAFISSETNFIADVQFSQELGSQAIIGILEPEENGDGIGRIVQDNVRGTIIEMIMTTINDVTYIFNRTLAIGNYQLTYDPTRDTGYYPDIVYQTPRGDKLTVQIVKGNMRRYIFDLKDFEHEDH
jgi:hypothetical protein